MDTLLEQFPDLFKLTEGRGRVNKPNGHSDHNCTVRDDFDFDECIIDNYELGGEWDGYYFITDICHKAGRKHSGSTKTGFYWNPETRQLGWHCFSGDDDGEGACSDTHIGDVLKLLNQDHAPCRPIWPEAELDPEMVDILEPEPDPTAAVTQVVLPLQEVLPSIIPPQPTSAVPISDPLASDTPEMTKVEIRDDDTGEIICSYEREALTDVPDAVIERVEESLEMPENAMCGYLGELAKQMKLPLGLAYPALLGTYSVVPDRDTCDGTRINLYVGLLSVVGGGKNVAMQRAQEILDVNQGWVAPSSPGGDRQLYNLIGDTVIKGQKGEPPTILAGPRKLLLVSNEMSSVVAKMGITNSSLGSSFTDLWDGNYKIIPASAGGSGRHTVNCRLSWIGGIPIDLDNLEEFTETFGRETGRGLMSRMLFGYSGERYYHHKWTVPAIPKPQVKLIDITDEMLAKDVDKDESMMWVNHQRDTTEVEPLIPEALVILADAWELTQEDRRAKYMLNKIMLLTAHASKCAEVPQEHFAAAIRFMEWQAKLKNVFKTGLAPQHSLEAQFAEACIDTLTRKGAVNAGAAATWTRLSNDLKWAKRFSPRIVSQGIAHLVAVGALAYGKKRKKNSKGDVIDVDNKAKVYLVQEED